MRTISKKTKDQLLHLVFLVLLTSVVFSLRAVSSITIGVMIVAGFLLDPLNRKRLFHNKNRNLFLVASTLFLLFQFIGLSFTDNPQENWANIRIKAGIILVPFAVFLSFPGVLSKKKLLQQFCLLLLVASIYCLVIAFLSFRQSGNTSVFFYHELVMPIRQHAVYFSLLVLIGLLFILESLAKKEFLFSKSLTTSLLIYLSGLLILLSSKYVIGFYVLFLLYFFARNLQRNKINRVTIAVLFLLFTSGIAIVLTTKNPVRERFSDILNGNINLVTQNQFNPGVYFNGLQFRLLQWRFVTEILQENKAWWLGVSSGDAQSALNEKYISKNMYAGDPSRGDRGYLAYNTHNQFLQTLLQNGIPGLLLLLLICYSLARLVAREKQILSIFTYILLLGWLFIESAFETQYGILIFTFFPLFLSHRDNDSN